MLAVLLFAWPAACAHFVRRCLGALTAPAESYPLLLSLGVLGALLPIACRTPDEAASRAIALAMLATTAWGDLRSGYIFDAATFPSAVLCIATAIALRNAEAGALALATTAAPLALATLWSRSAWIGWGDVKAVFSLALAFGVFESSLALFLASISGLAQALLRKSTSVRFGPHLAGGAFAATVLGPLVRPFVITGAP